MTTCPVCGLALGPREGTIHATCDKTSVRGRKGGAPPETPTVLDAPPSVREAIRNAGDLFPGVVPPPPPPPRRMLRPMAYPVVALAALGAVLAVSGSAKKPTAPPAPASMASAVADAVPAPKPTSDEPATAARSAPETSAHETTRSVQVATEPPKPKAPAASATARAHPAVTHAPAPPRPRPAPTESASAAPAPSPAPRDPPSLMQAITDAVKTPHH